MIDIVGRLRWIRDKVNSIFDTASALQVLQETGGTITSDGNEQDVYRIETPMGTFEPIKVQIDFTNQVAAGDTVVLREYYRIKSGGDLHKKTEKVIVGVQDPPVINIELEPNRFGIRVTLQKTIGAALTYDWTVFSRS